MLNAGVLLLAPIASLLFGVAGEWNFDVPFGVPNNGNIAGLEFSRRDCDDSTAEGVEYGIGRIFTLLGGVDSRLNVGVLENCNADVDAFGVEGIFM